MTYAELEELPATSAIDPPVAEPDHVHFHFHGGHRHAHVHQHPDSRPYVRSIRGDFEADHPHSNLTFLPPHKPHPSL